MSAYQVVGAIAGAVVGFYTRSPQLGFATYAAIAGVGAYMEQPDRIGPRLEDLRTQMSVYGAPIPFEYGCNRHAGTVIWPQILEAVEHEHAESAKGGGPEQKTYTYTMSLAVLVCEGPIAGIRRIWANKKLIYDVSITNEGATYDPSIGSVRIYLGTEDQEVDPLIEATDGPSPAYLGYAYVVFEDYDVTEMNGRPPQFEFEVVQNGDTVVPEAGQFGDEHINTGDSIQAAVDRNGDIWLASMDGHAEYDSETGTWSINPLSSGVPQIQQYNGDTHEIEWAINLPSHIEYDDPEDPYIKYPYQGSVVCSGGYFFLGRGTAGTVPNGSAYTVCTIVNIETKDIVYVSTGCSQSEFQNSFYFPTVPVPIVSNNKVFMSSSAGISSTFGAGFMPASIAGETEEEDIDPVPDYSSGTGMWSVIAGWAEARGKRAPCGDPGSGYSGVGITLPGASFISRTTTDPDGCIVQGSYSGDSFFAFLSYTPVVTSFNLNSPTIAYCVIPGSSTTMPVSCEDPGNNCFWVASWDGTPSLYQVTYGGGTGLTATSVYTWPAGTDVKGMCLDQTSGKLRILIDPGVSDPNRIQLFDQIAFTVLEEVILGIPLANETGQMFDVPSKKKVIFTNSFAMWDIPYGSPLDPSQIALSEIVEDICVRAGLGTTDIDVTQLTDMVDGYIVPRQMTARAAIEPLQQAYYFDAVESESKIKFVKRGSSTTTTIPMDDRAAHVAGQDMPAHLEITRAFETELPIQCDVEYPDIDADHQIGNQYDRRITKDTKHRINLQLAIVMGATKAKQIASTALYEAWQTNRLKWTTSRKYAHLEPTDIVTLPTAEASYRARITNRRDQPSGVIEWEGAEDAVEVYSQSGTGAVTPPYSPQTIFEADDTILALMDIPLLREEDDNAGYYVAMGGEA